MFVVTVISAIGNDDMVEQIDTHNIASFLHALGKFVIVVTGFGIVAWVVVTEGHDGGVA